PDTLSLFPFRVISTGLLICRCERDQGQVSAAGACLGSPAEIVSASETRPPDFARLQTLF
ncbi:hypothetical protein, partial [Pseudomonas aeruginosa]|uniref:hypothetical protein n=1 Tax=Pseudomonas aeruginosa TaxID=287 RepID=UPI00232EE8BD